MPSPSPFSACLLTHRQICDFGYSKHEKYQSAPGSRVGTPAYLAPEVIMTTKGKTYDGKVGSSQHLGARACNSLPKGGGCSQAGLGQHTGCWIEKDRELIPGRLMGAPCGCVCMTLREPKVAVKVAVCCSGVSPAATAACDQVALAPATPQVADIWSCGVMLYVMLVGAYPFERPEDKHDNQKLQKMIQVGRGGGCGAGEGCSVHNSAHHSRTGRQPGNDRTLLVLESTATRCWRIS